MKLTNHPTIIEAAKKSGADIHDPEIAAAIEAALQFGIAQEHERVMAHLRLGKMSGTVPGGLKLAHRAIEAGELMSPSDIAGYVESTRAAADLAAWYEDGLEVDEAIANVKPPPSRFTDPMADAVYQELRRLLDADKVDDTAIEDREVSE